MHGWLVQMDRFTVFVQGFRNHAQAVAHAEWLTGRKAVGWMTVRKGRVGPIHWI